MRSAAVREAGLPLEKNRQGEGERAGSKPTLVFDEKINTYK